LDKIREAGVRRRAEFFYQQLDALQALRQEVRRDLLAESRKHDATKLLRQIPCIGPIRAAQLVALIQMPHRFWTSGKSGPTAVLGSRRTTAGNTAASKDSCNVPGKRNDFAGSMKTTITISKYFQGCGH
jgi:transposase